MIDILEFKKQSNSNDEAFTTENFTKCKFFKYLCLSNYYALFVSNIQVIFAIVRVLRINTRNAKEMLTQTSNQDGIENRQPEV